MEWSLENKIKPKPACLYALGCDVVCQNHGLVLPRKCRLTPPSTTLSFSLPFSSQVPTCCLCPLYLWIRASLLLRAVSVRRQLRDSHSPVRSLKRKACGFEVVIVFELEGKEQAAHWEEQRPGLFAELRWTAGRCGEQQGSSGVHKEMQLRATGAVVPGPQTFETQAPRPPCSEHVHWAVGSHVGWYLIVRFTQALCWTGLQRGSWSAQACTATDSSWH